MTIKKIYDNWYQAIEIINKKTFWGYGRTPNEAIESLYKNDFEQELKKIINQKMEKVNCKNCKKEFDKIEIFSKGLCVDCYEKEYENLSEKEKIPNFINTINQ